MTQELDRGRRRARRWMAIVGFGFLIAYGILVVGALVFHPARDEIAAALATSTGAIAGFVTPVTVIVLAYIGVSLGESLQRMKSGGP